MLQLASDEASEMRAEAAAEADMPTVFGAELSLIDAPPATP